MRAGVIAAACACVVSCSPLAGQDSLRTAQDSAVRVFLDCPDSFCDFDYYRTEITFVNWVRDRQFAQVHLLITTQSTGGGREYTLTFIGLERFAGTVDTLHWTSSTTDTDDDIRRGLAKTMRLGIVRFVAKTPLAARLEISYNAPTAAVAQVHDPWNYWVFSTRVNTNFLGEKTYKFQYLSGGLSANRITADWKIQLSANASYRQTDFIIPLYDSNGVETGQDVITNIARSYGADALVGRSAGRHWSAGVRGSAFSSTYSNQDLTLNVGPAIEYDVFPYSESTRRLLTFQYRISIVNLNYADSTIFDKVAETRGRQSLTLSLDAKQPWGSAGVAIEGSHYLHDFSKNLLQMFGNGSFRIFKGLSFDFFANVELIHDQLFIRKGVASQQEVLLRRRQLATSYLYQGFMGLRYTFGSKYANVVNPRFGGGGGGIFFNF
jgi:hypothetical protein